MWGVITAVLYVARTAVAQMLWKIMRTNAEAGSLVPGSKSNSGCVLCAICCRAGAAFCGEMRNVVFARVSQSVIRNMAKQVRMHRAHAYSCSWMHHTLDCTFTAAQDLFYLRCSCLHGRGCFLNPYGHACSSAAARLLHAL